MGLKEPNAFGLYDMHGNVWEWCNDWWTDYYPAENLTDPAGPESGSERILRGGSGVYDTYSEDNAYLCRSAIRLHGCPECWGSLGFRVVRR